MDDQISRTILENFDVSGVDNTENDIHKITAPSVLKGIENGSLHFITVPTRDSEFIDHSLLNPEYITTHIANGGFIIDLMENQDGSNDNHSAQYISESLTNDLQFQSHEDNDRRLTATLFQFVKGNVRVGNETQVIVTNKDIVTGINTGETLKADSLDSHSFLTIEDSNTLTNSLLNEGQFKMFQPNGSSPATIPTSIIQTHNNNLPLPQLTPIRRLSRQRKTSMNSISNGTIETVNLNVQNLKTNDQIVDQNFYQRPVSKKVLPHKKRITKKLKAIDRNETQIIVSPPSLQQQHIASEQHQQINLHENSSELHEEGNINLTTSQFSCQLCGQSCESQLDFFSHLKEHYEPIKSDIKNEFVAKDRNLREILCVSKKEPTLTSRELHEVDLQFTEFGTDEVALVHQQLHEQNDLQIDQKHKSDTSNQFYQTDQFQHQQEILKQSHNHNHNQNQHNQQHFHSKLEDLPTQVLNIENKIISTCIPQETIIPTSSPTINQFSSNLSNSSTSPKFTPNEDHQLQLHIHQQQQQQHQQQILQHHLSSLSSISTPIRRQSTAQIQIPSKSIVIIQDEVEFSDTEDMLEGIRSVVDKVQDDTGDEMDMIVPNRIAWYSNNALNSDINLKSPRQQNLNSNNDDNFQIYFKNDVNIKDEQSVTNNNDINNSHDDEVQNLSNDDENMSQIKVSNSIQNTLHADNVNHNLQQATNIIVSDNLYANNIIATNSKNLSSSDDNTSDYIPSLSFTPKKVKKKRKPRKIKNKISSTKLKLQKKMNVLTVATPADSTNIVSIQPRRPRGRPSKIVENEKPPVEVIENVQNSTSDSNSDNNENQNDISQIKKNRKKHACNKCNKVFNSINALKYHDFSHTGERPHQCDVCGKSFFALNALRAHLRVHSGEKPFNCDECGRPFRQWGDLTYHKVSLHSNEKNFQCEFCGKAFARKYSLVIHRRIHTQERNYKCEFCPKTFRASSYLQNHRKIHTGEKPYICDTCNKKFRVCGDLKRHQKIHDREKKLEKHLDEIIKTEITPMEINSMKSQVELIITDKLSEETVTTYYYTTNETNLNNLLKTEMNGSNYETNLSTEIPTDEKTKPTILLSGTIRAPTGNKKTRKANAKKKKIK